MKYVVEDRPELDTIKDLGLERSLGLYLGLRAPICNKLLSPSLFSVTPVPSGISGLPLLLRVLWECQDLPAWRAWVSDGWAEV